MENRRIGENNLIRFELQLIPQTHRELAYNFLFLLCEIIALFVPVIAEIFLDLQLQRGTHILLLHIVVDRVEIILDFLRMSKEILEDIPHRVHSDNNKNSMKRVKKNAIFHPQICILFVCVCGFLHVREDAAR